MTSRKALITGVTGQDGSYLAELLLEKGYSVWGMFRRASSSNTSRIDHLLGGDRFELVNGDLNDASSIGRILKNVRPDEIYNLGAQSHVQVSFEIPEYTGEVTGVGTVRLLEAILELDLDARFYQASSSEMFGKVVETPQTEKTPFYPRSPYAVAKVYAHHITRNYREAYGLFGVNGILFNHESPRRGETFVTRKISMAAAAISKGRQDVLSLGNLDASRDWGHAADYVRAMWMMLQADEPRDYVIASGETHTVREFCELAFARVGLPITWQGGDLEEVGVDANGKIRVQIDERFFRPAEVDYLLGDASLAKAELGWEPEVSFRQLVEMMVDADLAAA
ncbi:MAG: GDP-mannose 4,6-dehydratase [Acidobacteriota bacterium]